MFAKDSTDVMLGAHITSSDPGAVGANKIWIDITSSPYAVKKRNSGNTGWDALGYLSSSPTANIDAFDFKASVRVATTANITLSGTQTIDGVSVIANDRVLVKNQTTGSQNGIYVCAAGAWSRATDADASSEVTAGMFVPVSEGTTNGDTCWLLTTNDTITLGTTALTFAQIGAGSSLSGLTTGNYTKATSSSTVGDAGLAESGTNAFFPTTSWTIGWGTGAGAIRLIPGVLGVRAQNGAGTMLEFEGGLRVGTSSPSIYISGAVSAAGGASFKNNQNVGWTSGSDATASQDVGFSRNASRKIEINDGTPISATDETHLSDLFLRQIYLTQTITATGTTGNQTINKAAGTVNIAAAGTAVTVTNSLVSANSIVLAVIRTNDSTATIKNVVPAAGSFTINLGAAATAEISIGFVVINK